MRLLTENEKKTIDPYGSDKKVIAIINSSKYIDVHGVEKSYHISNNTYYKYKKEIMIEGAETWDQCQATRRSRDAVGQCLILDYGKRE